MVQKVGERYFQKSYYTDWEIRASIRFFNIIQNYY
jgi:hypothetical protein